MNTPPRRSRPRKPSETIDSTAERIEPIEPQTADAPGRDPGDGSLAASDPETRLGDEATTRAETTADAAPTTESGSLDAAVEGSGIAALGEAEPGDRNAPPAGDGTVRETEPGELPEGDLRQTLEAENERRADDERPSEPADAEAILAGAGPHAADDPRPELDYHQTSPHSEHGQGAGLGSVLGAALLGAAIALLAAGLLQYAGVIPAVREPDMAQLGTQFARAGDVQQLTTDLNTVRGDVGQLQSTLSAGGAGGQPGPSGADFAALADRFNNLETRINGLSGGGGQAGAPAVDPAALQGATDAANGARQVADGARQAADGARAAAEGAQNQANEARQTAQTAQQAAGTAQQAADVAQQAANGAMEAARGNGEAISEIRNRIGSVEDANRKAAVAISAASLKAAVDRGGSFMAELETYATAAGGSAPAVDALRNYAAEGVPPLATLQNEWPDVRREVLRALKPNDPNAGVGQQILSGLNSLVAVRPTAGAGGSGGGNATGPEASVVKLDQAMDAGRLDSFTTEWQTLPEPARNAGADFARRAEARAKTEGVVGEALGSAVNTIGKAN